MSTLQERRIRACVEAIDQHAQALAAATQSSLWALAAQTFGAEARDAVRAEDWGAAQAALHEALDRIVGGYGLRPAPRATAAWAIECEELLGW